MAVNIVYFDEATLAFANAVHNLSQGGDVLKLALITNATAPDRTDATPTLGDYTQVSGGGYTAGGATITATSTDLSEVGGLSTRYGDKVTFSQSGSGFNDAYHGLIYNSSKSDQAIGFITFGAAQSNLITDFVVRFGGLDADGAAIKMNVP